MRSYLLDPGLDGLADSLKQFSNIRLILWAILSVLVYLTISIVPAVGLAAAACGAEASIGLAASSFVQTRQETTLRRWLTLGAITALTMTASGVVAIFWTAGSEAMRLGAAYIAITYLVHTQIYMFRSRISLLIGCITPTATLLVLVIFFARYDGLELLTIAILPILIMAYVLVGGIANKRSFDDLEAAKMESDRPIRRNPSFWPPSVTRSVHP